MPGEGQGPRVGAFSAQAARGVSARRPEGRALGANPLRAALNEDGDPVRALGSGESAAAGRVGLPVAGSQLLAPPGSPHPAPGSPLPLPLVLDSSAGHLRPR